MTLRSRTDPVGPLTGAGPSGLSPAKQFMNTHQPEQRALLVAEFALRVVVVVAVPRCVRVIKRQTCLCAVAAWGTHWTGAAGPATAATAAVVITVRSQLPLHFLDGSRTRNQARFNGRGFI